jgi:hypothetical protein
MGFTKTAVINLKIRSMKSATYRAGFEYLGTPATKIVK